MDGFNAWKLRYHINLVAVNQSVFHFRNASNERKTWPPCFSFPCFCGLPSFCREAAWLYTLPWFQRPKQWQAAKHLLNKDNAKRSTGLLNMPTSMFTWCMNDVHRGYQYIANSLKAPEMSQSQENVATISAHNKSSDYVNMFCGSWPERNPSPIPWPQLDILPCFLAGCFQNKHTYKYDTYFTCTYIYIYICLEIWQRIYGIQDNIIYCE